MAFLSSWTTEQQHCTILWQLDEMSFFPKQKILFLHGKPCLPYNLCHNATPRAVLLGIFYPSTTMPKPCILQFPHHWPMKYHERKHFWQDEDMKAEVQWCATLTREPSWLKPSDSAQVLQYGRGPPPPTSWPQHCVSTPHQFFVIHFIFQFLHRYFISLIKVCTNTTA